MGNYLQAKNAHSQCEYSVVRYGKNSAPEIELLGIVHAEFRDGRVIRQWVLLDDQYEVCSTQINLFATARTVASFE